MSKVHVYRVPNEMYDVLIPPEGADLPEAEANALIERGLVTTDSPAAKPEPAAKAKPKAKPRAKGGVVRPGATFLPEVVIPAPAAPAATEE